MKFNFKTLVNFRMWLMNFDTDQTDITAGIRFNRDHYAKALEARHLKLNAK